MKKVKMLRVFEKGKDSWEVQNPVSMTEEEHEKLTYYGSGDVSFKGYNRAGDFEYRGEVALLFQGSPNNKQGFFCSAVAYQDHKEEFEKIATKYVKSKIDWPEEMTDEQHSGIDEDDEE